MWAGSRKDFEMLVEEQRPISIPAAAQSVVARHPAALPAPLPDGWRAVATPRDGSHGGASAGRIDRYWVAPARPRLSFRSWGAAAEAMARDAADAAAAAEARGRRRRSARRRCGRR